MKKAFSTPSWFVLATVYTLLGILFASGSVWAQTATAPGAPTIDSLTTGNESIAVSWTAPASNGGSDITSYDLRHIGSDATDKSDDNWTVEDNVWSSGALQATITGLTNGASYDVQARAINAIGNGSWSPTVSGKAATVPTAPRLAYAVPRSGQITITWSSPVSDGGSEVTSYDLRYIRSDADDSVDANWTLKENFSQVTSSYKIRGLTNGVAYHVQVRAINAVGAGAWFERVTRTPTGPPGIPSIDTVTPGDESLTITWSPPASDGGEAITGYNLRYVRDDFVTGNFLFVWNHESGIWTSGDALEYTLSGLDNNVRYRLGLQAANSEGTSGWSDWSGPRTGVAGVPPDLPGAPTIDRAISNETMVDIEWFAPANDGGADISSYDLRYILSDAADKADDNWTVLERVWSSGALTYTVRGLTADVQYDFQLSAVNSAGAGDWSATVVNIDPSPPGAPTIGFFSDETPGQLWIPWFTPADDGGAPITHYDLRHIRSDATDRMDADWTQVDDLSGMSYTIAGLTSDVRYDVQVRAVNRAGDGSWSGTVTASPRPPRPNPPGNISATPGDGTLTVTWSAAPVKAGVTVAGYKVSYIRTDHPGWGDRSNWTTSDLIPSDTLQYAITGLENGVRYSIDAYSVSSAERTSPPPDALPVHSPGRVPAALGELKRILTAESSIFISWIGPSDNGGHTVTSYDIHHHPTSDPTNVARRSFGAPDIVEGLSATNVTWVGNLTPHVEYEIRVRARNRIGAGPWSSLTLIPRARPVDLTVDSVTPGDGSLTVSWTDGDDDEITGYELRYIDIIPFSVAPDSTEWNYIRNITGTSPLTHTIGRLENGVAYIIQLRGKNRYGDTDGELPSDWGRWKPGACCWLYETPRTTPDAPAIGSVTSGDRKLTVAWSAPAEDGGANITHYKIRHIRSDAADKSDANWTVNDSIWTSGALRYALSGLTNGVEYDVQVRAVNAAGDGPWSATRTGTPLTRPGAPSIDSVTPGDETLAVAWSAPATDGGRDITSYDLRYIRSDAPSKADSNWTERDGIWTSGALRHILSGLTNGVEYDVQVRAVNAVGNGAWSGAGAGKPLTTPSAPTIDSVTPGDETLTVSWSAPSDTGGSEVTGYDLRYIRSDAPSKADVNWTERDGVWSSGALHYTLSGLTNGVGYDLQVRAESSVSEGPWSPVGTGTPLTTPGAPSIDSVTPGDETLAVAWSAPASNGGRDITGYDLRYIRSDAPNKADANWTVRDGIWTSGALRHILSGLTNGVDYDVQLRAVNAVGNGAWSGTAAGKPLTTPSPPTVDSVTPGDETLTVSWSAPADTGGSEVTGYDLRYIRSDAPSKADANWTERDSVWSSGLLSYELDGLTNGVRYDLQIRAVNIAGDGRWSVTISGTPQTIPAAPTIDSVTPGDETLTIAWSAPADTGGSTVEGYDARYIRSDAADKADANWTEQDGIWTSGALQYALPSLTNGVRYDVQLRAVTGAGNGPWSAPTSATPQTAPDAPTINLITVGDGALAVSWSAPSDTGGTAITSYDARYIRSDAADKADDSWTERDGIWTSGVLRYTVDSLTNGVGYDLQVRAVNRAGDGSWSATATATPQTVTDAPTIDLITPGDGTLAVSWSAPSEDGGSAITSYEVRYIRSDALDKADDSWTVRDGIWTSGPLSYDLDGLTNGVRYDVQLRAVTGAGNGPWSAPTSATPQTAPDAPTINLITVGDGALAVSWSAPSEDGGTAITSYDARYIRSDAADKSDDSWTEQDGIWTSGVRRYTVDSLTNGVGYDVQVRAVNVAGEGPWSATASATPQTVTDAPTINLITPGDGTLAVSWSAPSDTGGSAITSYDVRHIRSDALDKADDSWTVRDGIWTSGDLEYTLSGLTNGVGYDVQLRAVNDAGDGPWSAIATDTPRTTPGAPTIDVVSPGNYALSITWSAPADDGGSAITSYDLRYILSDATDKADDNWTVREDIWSSGLQQYGLNESTGFNLSGGVRYDVQVRAVNAVGNGSWSASETGTPSTVNAPSAPASLLVTPGDGSLSIAWSAPADDGGAAITSYDLRYISSDVQDRSDASWTVEEDVWSSGALEYTLDGLTNGDRYDMQVRAVNEVGNGPWSATAAGIQVGSTSNVPPEFTEGDSATRSVVEGATSGAAVGDPVAATDADNDTLNYTLEGDDAGSFAIDAGTGQITVGAGTTLDYGARPAYVVSVTATDPSGYSAAIAVTITVTDDDLGVIGSRYDADNDGVIDKAEVIKAINDYLFGEGDEAISKADVITLINAYLFD